MSDSIDMPRGYSLWLWPTAWWVLVSEIGANLAAPLDTQHPVLGVAVAMLWNCAAAYAQHWVCGYI